MVIGIAIVILLTIVVFLVFLPLMGYNQDKPDFTERDESLNALDTNKEAVLTTINEIEFEYKMKKLSDDDYTNLTNEYKQKALEILRDEDELELEAQTTPGKFAALTREELEAEIDRDLATIRKQRK